MASLPAGVALRELERVTTQAGTRGSRMSLWLSRPCRGDWDPSVLADAGREKTSSTSIGAPPPHRQDALMPECGVHYLWFAFVCFLIRSHTPPSAGNSSIRRL